MTSYEKQLINSIKWFLKINFINQLFENMAGFESGPLLFEPLQSLMEAGLDESCRILVNSRFIHTCEPLYNAKI